VLTLYSTPLSANGRKALAVARHLGLEPRIELVNVYRGEGRTPEFLAIHPAGKVPVLVDGDFVLTESNAILQYLSEAHGEHRLWSREPRRRADIARWLFWEASQWQPAFVPVLSGFVGRLLVPQLAHTPEQPVNWDDAAFQAVVGRLDAHLHGREFVAGAGLTIADFSLAGMAMFLRPAGFPFELFPALDAWYARIEAIPAWRATAAGPWE
jgi:glutathione S-transferase